MSNHLTPFTPLQNRIEKIIIEKKFSSEHAEILRNMSELADNLRSTLHYHTSHYIEHLIMRSDEIIASLEK